MRRISFALLAASILTAGVAGAAGSDRYTSGSLRGRYSGNLVISERIPVDADQTIAIEARQLLALTFDGKSAVNGVTSVTAVIPNTPPSSFTCVFTVAGTYQVGAEGLGSADLTITPTSDCTTGPAGLKLSLLVGGRHRSRLDVTIDAARGPNGEDPGIAIVGAGALIAQ